MHGFFTRLAVLVLMAALANAGDCLSGSSCCNQCPLAHQANARLSDGHEALASSKLVRADIVRRVLDNMEAL
jgi:hypothetical protein